MNEEVPKDDKKQIKTYKEIFPQIYSYTLPERKDHEGWQKIGYTERYDVDERIKEQVRTAAINEKYNKLWNAPALYYDGTRFEKNDHSLHEFYIKNSIPKSDENHLGREWFYFDGTPEKSKALFDDFTKKKHLTLAPGAKQTYKLRDEQEHAVSQTLAYAENNQTTDFANPNEDADFLWNAKPRFGKTLATYDFAKRFGAKNVLIITNRPAIANSWFDDYDKFIDGYYFISETDALKNRKVMSREDFLHRQVPRPDDKQIVFLSLQDLKGGKKFGGKFEKLDYIADINWDLLVYDESHEASDTDKTIDALKNIKRRFSLYLSGTPFKALANNRFHADQIFNWTYLDEQKAKEIELKNGDETGAHTNLPDLRLFTYRMSDIIVDQVNEGAEIDGKNYDYAFDLNEMFATNNSGRFFHEDEIKKFLDELTTNKKYPFSTPELRDELKHTFWLVGNRVASAQAMEALLRNHPVFKNYKIVIAAGDGRKTTTFDNDDEADEEVEDLNRNQKSFDRVKAAIANNDKTITLSVGQLTTGVTIKEWSAVLMLSDIKSESLYMQAIFRAQNPYEYVKDGQIYQKKSAYVFDFSPNRVLTVYDKFANGLQAESVNGETTTAIREKCIAELLNYFPVLAEDESGEMIELDAEKVLTFPKAIIAREVVNRGFVTNLLFANIDHVFNIPTEVINVLNKAKTTNDSGREVAKKDVEHDRDRAKNREHKISVNKKAMLGNKVYGNAMLDVVNDSFNKAASSGNFNDRDFIENVTQKVVDVAEEPIAVYIEQYSPTKSEIDDVRKKLRETVVEKAEEFVSKEIKDDLAKNEFAKKLAEIIEEDLPKDTVGRVEDDNYKKEEKTELDEIRAKLRTFTRAIPSFIMAAKNPENITLDNIENTVSDAEFIEIFSEQGEIPFTKDDFKKLRDPGVYHEADGTEVKFDGFFDRYTFNAAIREFEEKRIKLADYLTDESKEDIFTYIRPLKTNQIFTPRKVVNMMLDMLEEENPGIFENPDLTFADLYVKSGLYLTEIAKRLYRGLENKIPDRTERIKHIFEHQLYGFAPTGIIYNIAHKYIYGNFTYISDANFIQKDLTETFKKGETLDMKFDVIVGNPPYQINDAGGKRDDGSVNASASPIYQYFVESSKKISQISCLIMPGRWLSGAGKGLNDFTSEMLNDTHIKALNYHLDSKDIFPAVDIKGGVIYYCWDNGYDGPANITVTASGETENSVRMLKSASGTFIPFVKLDAILNKVLLMDPNLETKNIQSITSVRKPYGLSTDVFKNPAKYKLPPMHLARENDDDIEILGLENNKRVSRFVPKDYPIPTGRETIGKWKVFIPYAYGCGAIGEVIPTPILGTPILGTPIQICTETYLRIGAFDSKDETNAMFKYLKTKFFRVMVGILKTTQHSTTTYKFVPLQNFTTTSDIDWSKSIPEIDQQLYKKYNLSEDEIDFIETRVKPME